MNKLSIFLIAVCIGISACSTNTSKKNQSQSDFKSWNDVPNLSHKVDSVLSKMTIEEKNKLKEHIVSLPQDKLAGIISIIQDTLNASKNNDVLEFDIDSLPTRKCRELEQYVEKAMGGPKPVKKKSISRPQLPKHTNVR